MENEKNTTCSNHPDSTSLSNSYNPVKGEEALWRAVITQALMDASSNSRKPEYHYIKTDARHWLLSGSADFQAVCMLAGFNPDYVRTKAAQALARNCQWRNIPTAAAISDSSEKRLSKTSKKKPSPQGISPKIIQFPLSSATPEQVAHHYRG